MKRLLFVLLLVPQLAFSTIVIESVLSLTSIVISNGVTYNTNNTISTDIDIVAGGTLTIKATTTMANGTKVTVYSGGMLVIDGGELLNADIVMQSGSELRVKNDGLINLASNAALEIPAGAVSTISNGTIN